MEVVKDRFGNVIPQSTNQEVKSNKLREAIQSIQTPVKLPEEVDKPK